AERGADLRLVRHGRSPGARMRRERVREARVSGERREGRLTMSESDETKTTTTETRDLIARARATIAPADQPQAPRDLARTADGEPRVDAGMLLDVADDPAAWVFYAPREEIHAMIREMGGDPEKLAEEGRQLAEGLLAKNLVGDFTQIEPLSNEEA